MAVVYGFIFVIGIFFGSFSTLALYRIPLGLDITHERSFCPKCGHKLGALDLIPLVSFIFLGGRCRYCKEKISIRYFLIEICFGLFSVALFWGISVIRKIVDLWSLGIFLVSIIMFEVLVLFIGVRIKKKTIDSF